MADGSGTMFGNTIPGPNTAGRLLCTLTHPQNPGQQWAKAGMTIWETKRKYAPIDLAIRTVLAYILSCRYAAFDIAARFG
jgi:hypothetical protein